MNTSENLISLSDSGVGSAALSFSSTPKKQNNVGSVYSSPAGGCGLLVDLTDAVQGPVPQALMTLAEVDDTFGIFSRVTSSQEVEHKVAGLDQSDVASKLVRSFTSGRKSDDFGVSRDEDGGVTGDSKVEPAEKPLEEVEKGDVSCASINSELPTIIDDSEVSIPLTTSGSDGSGAEHGIQEEKICEASFSQASGGSDSVLDVNNLSSFSLPDADSLDEYLNDIRGETQAEASIAIVEQIKRELRQDKESPLSASDSKNNNPLILEAGPSSSIAVANVTSFSSTTVSHSSGPSLASRSSISNTESTQFQREKPLRLSGIMSSPIRTSYPFPNPKYMPTPCRTYSSPGRSNQDKLSASMYSPNSVPVVKVNGDERKFTPIRRAPLRKSISCETLQLEGSPVRDTHATYKFSTPARTRHSYSHSADQAAQRADEGEFKLPLNAGKEMPFQLPVVPLELQTGWRKQRLSTASSASSASNTSFVTANATATSPVSSTVSSTTALADVVKQLRQLKVAESKFARPTTTAAFVAVQPMRATAIIPPTNASMVESEVNQHHNPVVQNASTYGGAATISGQQQNHQTYIPPIVASSPKVSQSPARAVTQITPSRVRQSITARSSGYGQQNLNSTLGMKPPLTSPNPKVLGNIKAPAFPKPVRGALFANQSETDKTGAIVRKSVISSLPASSGPKIVKAPTISGNTGLRRPTSGTATTNKENTSRIGGLPSRIGSMRPRQ